MINPKAAPPTSSSTLRRTLQTSSIKTPRVTSQASSQNPSSVQTPTIIPKASRKTTAKPSPQTLDEDIWPNAVTPAPNRFPKLQRAKPLAAPAKRLFRRTSFLSKKKVREIEQALPSDGIAGKYIPTPPPKRLDTNLRTYRQQLLKRALNERPERPPPRPTVLPKPVPKPKPEIRIIKVEELQTPISKDAGKSGKDLVQSTKEDSPLDVSMVDVFTSEPVCKVPPPTLDYIGDVTMKDAPPVKTLRFAESVVNGEPVLLAPKYFYKELAINELPADRSPYRQPPPEYDMENPTLYDTPPDRFAASRNLSPENTSEQKGPMFDELLAIINEWHAELRNTPDVEKPSKHYYDWIDRRVQHKQQQEAAHAAYQQKIKEAAEEKAHQEEEARKAKEALVALKIKQEAEKKAKEEEEARRKAEAAAAAAEKKAREEELRKQREALEARIIKPLSQEWATKVTTAMAGTRTDIALTSDGIPLTRRDLGKILPQPGIDDPSGWLNDEVINRFFGHLALRAREKEGWKAGTTPPLYHNFSSAFMDTLKQRGPEALLRWASRAKFPGPKLLDVKAVFIPVCAGQHWRLVVVYPTARRIEYLDSLNPMATGTAEEHVRGVKSWIGSQLKERFVEGEWKVMYGRSGIQSNCNDCGVFTCFNGFAVVRRLVPKEVVTATLMPEARRQMAATLLNEGFKGEFDWE